MVWARGAGSDSASPHRPCVDADPKLPIKPGWLGNLESEGEGLMRWADYGRIPAQQVVRGYRWEIAIAM